MTDFSALITANNHKEFNKLIINESIEVRRNGITVEITGRNLEKFAFGDITFVNSKFKHCYLPNTSLQFNGCILENVKIRQSNKLNMESTPSITLYAFETIFSSVKFENLDFDSLHFRECKKMDIEISSCYFKSAFKMYGCHGVDSIKFTSVSYISNDNYREVFKDNKNNKKLWPQWSWFKVFQALPILTVNYIMLFFMVLVLPVLRTWLLKANSQKCEFKNLKFAHIDPLQDLLCYNFNSRVWLLFISTCALFVVITTHNAVMPKTMVLIEGGN